MIRRRTKAASDAASEPAPEDGGPALERVSCVRVRPSLMAHLRGWPLRQMATPRGARAVKAGERLFLREWNGGPTGRADLVRVLSVNGMTCEVYRTWGWSQSKDDADLSDLGLATGPDIEFEILGEI